MLNLCPPSNPFHILCNEKRRRKKSFFFFRGAETGIIFASLGGSRMVLFREARWLHSVTSGKALVRHGYGMLLQAGIPCAWRALTPPPSNPCHIRCNEKRRRKKSFFFFRGADWVTLYELKGKEEADREHSPTCFSISSTYDFEKRSVENLSWKLYVMTMWSPYQITSRTKVFTSSLCIFISSGSKQKKNET